jgi:hypothetical protein
MATRSNWSRLLPWALIIPDVMTLKTLADVRTLTGHLPADRRNRTLQAVDRVSRTRHRHLRPYLTRDVSNA